MLVVIKTEFYSIDNKCTKTNSCLTKTIVITKFRNAPDLKRLLIKSSTVLALVCYILPEFLST